MEELRRQLAEIEAHNGLINDYQKTLALLRALKAGTISLDNVLPTPNGWQLVEVHIEPAAPAAVDPPASPPDNPVAEKTG